MRRSGGATPRDRPSTETLPQGLIERSTAPFLCPICSALPTLPSTLDTADVLSADVEGACGPTVLSVPTVTPATALVEPTSIVFSCFASKRASTRTASSVADGACFHPLAA